MDFKQLLVGLVFVASLIFLGFIPEQSHFTPIFASYSIAFLSFFVLVFHFKIKIKYLVLLAILPRIFLLFSFPNLSNDIYRFIWDGYLLHQGISPYHALPTAILQSGQYELSQLYTLLNSPDYYSVYPPIAQLVFWISTFFEGIAMYYSSFIIKFILLIGDIFSLIGLHKLLGLLKLDKRLAFVYLLNPLIIIEQMGNVHFEGLMICFLIWALYFILCNRMIIAGAFLAISVATKLLPLIFLPFIWRYTKLNKKFLISFTLSSLAFFSIVLWQSNTLHFLESIDLYFGKFEFNGSIYYLARYIGMELSGYNLIRYLGPGLGLITLSTCIYLFIKQKERDFQSLAKSSFIAFTTYLLLATTIHPWYLSLLLFWNIFKGRVFPIAWSCLIFLTYMNYSKPEYKEHLWIVAIEYLIVLSILIYEHSTSKLEA